jgi:hypothetical protein
VNVAAFEVPLAVVIVTCADAAPEDGGTVIVQAFGAGQLVEVTCPLKLATMWPSGLRKFEPAIWTDCPGAPVDGLSAEITGAAPGTTGVVVVVVVVLEEDADPPGEPACPVEGRAAPACAVVGTVDEVVAVGWLPPPSE